MNQPNEGMQTPGPGAAAGPAMPPPAAAAPAWEARYTPVRNRKSPFLAGLFSFLMPGLGQVYLGYYQRGFVHAAVFVGFIGALSSIHHGPEAMFGVGLGFFYLYNIVDAARRATLYNQAVAGLQPTPLPEDFKMPTGQSSLFWGLIVTGLGVLLLLYTRFDFDLDWLEDWWPALLVLVGARIVFKSRKQ